MKVKEAWKRRETKKNSERERMMTITYKRVTFHKNDVEGDDPGYMLKNRLSLYVGHM